MNSANEGRARPPGGPPRGDDDAARPEVGPYQRRQVMWITAGALAVFALLRVLPTGTSLSHMDFRVTAKNAIDFCDPLSPQFIPVVAVASPVTMTLATTTAAKTGVATRATVRLRTASGKPIAPEDLIVAHTRKLHLLIVDPTLADYQHVHPTPAHAAGDWEFSYTPRADGVYRVFADFTPTATGRGLYASADLPVGRDSDVTGGAEVAHESRKGQVKDLPYRFALTPATNPIHAKWPTDLKLTMVRADGGAVPLEPVMGAFAHLVAFDQTRSGFAHLHPMEADVTQKPDAVRPSLNFKITIPREGRYVIWAQVNLDGRDVFEPFWFEVVK